MADSEVERVMVSVEVFFKSGRRERHDFMNVVDFQNWTVGNHLHLEGDLRPVGYQDGARPPSVRQAAPNLDERGI